MWSKQLRESEGSLPEHPAVGKSSEEDWEDLPGKQRESAEVTHPWTVWMQWTVGLLLNIMLWDSSMSAKLAWDYYIKFHNFLSISSFFQLLPIKIFIAMNILLKIYLFFNWRIIALQYWFHFCHTSSYEYPWHICPLCVTYRQNRNKSGSAKLWEITISYLRR